VRPIGENARLATPPALLGSGMTHAVVVRRVTVHRCGILAESEQDCNLGRSVPTE